MRAHLLGTQLLLAKLHDGRGAHGRGARGGRRTRKLRRRKCLDGAEEGQHERGKHPRRSRHPSEYEVSLRFPEMRLNGRGKLRQRTGLISRIRFPSPHLCVRCSLVTRRPRRTSCEACRPLRLPPLKSTLCRRRTRSRATVRRAARTRGSCFAAKARWRLTLHVRVRSGRQGDRHRQDAGAGPAGGAVYSGRDAGASAAAATAPRTAEHTRVCDLPLLHPPCTLTLAARLACHTAFADRPPADPHDLLIALCRK